MPRCPFCSQKFTRSLAANRLDRHIFDLKSTASDGYPKLRPCGQLHRPKSCPICHVDLDENEHYYEQYNRHIRPCLYPIARSSINNVQNALTVPTTAGIASTSPLVPHGRQAETIEVESRGAVLASATAVSDSDQSVLVNESVPEESSSLVGDGINDQLTALPEIAATGYLSASFEDQETLPEATVTFNASWFDSIDGDYDEPYYGSTEGASLISDNPVASASFVDDSIESDDQSSSFRSESDRESVDGNSNVADATALESNSDTEMDIDSQSVDTRAAIEEEHKQAVREMLAQCDDHIQLFWQSFQAQRRKLAVSPSFQMRHAHPFTRVPYTTEDKICLDMLNRMYNDNATENHFENILRYSEFIKRSQTDCRENEDDFPEWKPSTDLFSTYDALKTVGRKFARKLYNLKPSNWNSPTHREPPAYTCLEGIITGWMACPSISKIITDVNVDHTIPYFTASLDESYSDLKSRLAGNGSNRHQDTQYCYGPMHTGYQWLLSIKAVQEKWEPAWKYCKSKNIPVLFVHIILFADAFKAFSTKQKSLYAVVASAGEFPHNFRSNGIYPTLVLQSLFPKYHQTNPQRNIATTSLVDVQTLLNLEYEGLNRGKFFFNQSINRNCCIVAVEHVVTGDGPGKSEYFGTSGYNYNSRRGCPLALCESSQYRHITLNPGMQVTRLRGSETTRAVEDFRNGRITLAEAVEIGIKDTMPTQFTPGLPFFERQCPDVMHCDGHGNMQFTLKLFNEQLTRHFLDDATHKRWWQCVMCDFRDFCKQNDVEAPPGDSAEAICADWTMASKAVFPIYSYSSFVRHKPTGFNEDMWRIWCLRVEHSKLCLRHQISEQELQKMEEVGAEMRRLIVPRATAILSPRIITLTMNMHMESHYGLSVRRFGVLRETAVYGMENLLFGLKKDKQRNSNGKSVSQKIRVDFLIRKATKIKLNEVDLPVRECVLRDRNIGSSPLTITEKGLLREIECDTGNLTRYRTCILNYEKVSVGQYLKYKIPERKVQRYGRVHSIIRIQRLSESFVVLCCKIKHRADLIVSRHFLEEEEEMVCIQPENFVGRTLVDTINDKLYAMHTIQ